MTPWSLKRMQGLCVCESTTCLIATMITNLNLRICSVIQKADVWQNPTPPLLLPQFLSSVAFCAAPLIPSQLFFWVPLFHIKGLSSTSAASHDILKRPLAGVEIKETFSVQRRPQLPFTFSWIKIIHLTFVQHRLQNETKVCSPASCSTHRTHRNIIEVHLFIDIYMHAKWIQFCSAVYNVGSG